MVEGNLSKTKHDANNHCYETSCSVPNATATRGFPSWRPIITPSASALEYCVAPVTINQTHCKNLINYQRQSVIERGRRTVVRWKFEGRWKHANLTRSLLAVPVSRNCFNIKDLCKEKNYKFNNDPCKIMRKFHVLPRPVRKTCDEK